MNTNTLLPSIIEACKTSTEYCKNYLSDEDVIDIISYYQELHYEENIDDFFELLSLYDSHNHYWITFSKSRPHIYAPDGIKIEIVKHLLSNKHLVRVLILFLEN